MNYKLPLKPKSIMQIEVERAGGELFQKKLHEKVETAHVKGNNFRIQTLNKIEAMKKRVRSIK